MAPSAASQASFILTLSAVLLGVCPTLGSAPLKCWLVEEVGQPKTIRQTPVLLAVNDATRRTPEPGTLLFYVSDPSGKLAPLELSSCEMTVHLPQEVSLSWVRHLTREEVSPVSLGDKWYSVTMKSEKDEVAISMVLGPVGDKKDHMAVSLAVYSSAVTVKGQLGKPLALPCGVWRGSEPRFAVEWRHRALGDGKVLYAYDGWQDRVEEEIPGYTLNFSKLHSGGDASLLLEKVDVSHDGTYLCIAYLPYLRSQRDVHLQVTAKPEISLLPSPLFARPGEEVTLSCEISHFHPLEISVDFLVQLPGAASPSLLPAASLSPHSRNQDGTYNIAAHQRFNASPELHGARYTCLVKHASSPRGMTRTQTVQIAGVAGPSIEDGMYLFLVALLLYGLLSYLHRRVQLFFRSPEQPNDKKLVVTHMNLRNLRTALEEERRGQRPRAEAKDEQNQVLQYEGEKEQDGATFSVYQRSTQQAPVKVLTIRAGTLPRLVQHLLEARTLGDTSYIPVFLATYRTFTSTAEVLALLLDRLHGNNHAHSYIADQSHGGKDDDLSSLFCAWMSQYPEDFLSLDPKTRQRLSDCFSRLQKRNLVTQLEELHPAEKDGVDLSPTTPGDKAETSDPLDILTFQAGHVAEQLTCLEASLFLKVVPYECLGSVWSRRDRGGEHCDRCHSVRETVRQFNRLSGAVTASCVQDPLLRPQQRARIIEKWVKVAEECWSLRNFSSVYAILSALQSTAVHRLKRVWAETSREIQRSYQEMSEVFSEKDNYSRMRELLFQSQDTPDALPKRHPPRPKDARATGVIPYLGVFLTDLVMLDSAIRDHLENGYLNFEKRRKEFESLSQIRILQSVCLGYRIAPDPQFVSWFLKLRSMTEDESYRLSRDIEPTTQDAAPVTPAPVKPTVVITHCTDLLASIVAPFGPGMHLVAWDSPADRLMTPNLTAQQRSPSVPALDAPSSPKPPPKASLTPNLGLRTHRRSASCGTPLNAIFHHGTSAEQLAEPMKLPDPTEDHRIIRARVEPAEETSVYKSVRVSSQDKAPAVIDRILRKHHNNTQGPYELVQLLPGNKELVFPGTSNVFYAMSAASQDFLVRPQPTITTPPPDKTHLRAHINATYPKIKVKAGDLARSFF